MPKHESSRLPEPVSTGKGRKYVVEVRVYPDGHGNFTGRDANGDFNYPVANPEEAIGAFRGALATRATQAVIAPFDKLCGLAFVDERGRVVDVSSADRDRVMLADREVRREIVKWSGMGQGRGRVILLRRPAGLR